MNREFLMLAHPYDPSKHRIGGWYASEKLDGMRAFWDGGVSRGVAASEVPWANTEKNSRYQREIIATGLWSRYGNVIHAPGWWLDALPPYPRDGELWIDRGCFQSLVSITKRLDPDDSDWKSVRYIIFDTPSLSNVLSDGKINNPNFKKVIGPECLQWCRDRKAVITNQRSIETILLAGGQQYMHPQEQLPLDETAAVQRMYEILDTVVSKNGEGLILRNPRSIWTPKRIWALLKVKQCLDAEGVITGFVSGRATDKGSKLLGKIGALVLAFGPQARRLELSGFTDAEREFDSHEAIEYAIAHPGSEMPKDLPFQGRVFKIGDTVTFKYRELTDDGIPKEARYFRKGTVA